MTLFLSQLGLSLRVEKEFWQGGVISS